MMAELAMRFKEGGSFMWVILAFGILTLAFIVDRVIALYFRTKEAPASLRKDIQKLVLNGDLAAATSKARSAGNGTALGKIAALGCHLRANAAGEEEIQARMDEALSAEISKLDKRTAFLAMFGNVATLVGLLGTIVGMTHSFAAVAAASAADRSTLLSKGISEAMNCTAFGLLVAIPALVAYAIFQNKTDKMVARLTEGTTEIFNDLLFLSDSSAEAAVENELEEESEEEEMPVSSAPSPRRMTQGTQAASRRKSASVES